VPLKVLIVPDKFKGTLTAAEAATAIGRGWNQARPQDHLDLLPMSDGGDGFGQIAGNLLRARPRKVRTMDAAHRACEAVWWFESKTRMAIIESANVIGLAMLPPGKFHPFDLDTFGLGTLIRAAARKGAKRCLIGIGGSATNDGGFGMARALGWKFLDRAGNAIERWTELHRLNRIQNPLSRLRFDELTVAVDVRNPFLGPRGATRVFGPQKGLKPSELAQAEKNLRKLANVASSGALKLAAEPGSGAAGGLGFGLVQFLNGRLESGFELFARFAGVDERLRAADLVITGEGCLDQSTLMGKGAGAIAQRCRQSKRACLALVGTISPETLKHPFTAVRSLTDLTTPANARRRSALWLQRLAREIASAQPDES
jgi:glycerate kinase